MYLLIASPDKISISMFINFYKNHIEKGCPVGTLQYLMTNEDLNNFIINFKNKYSKGIITYYTKSKNTDPMSVIPKDLMDNTDIVLWFDLYSTEVRILKDMIHFMSVNENLWKKHIEKMGG